MEDLLKQFEKEFETMKKELGFSAGLDDLDKIFFLRDMILKERYVSKTLSRQVCMRMTETYFSWVNYLHNLISPNPSYMVNVNESMAFSEKEKAVMGELIGKIMILISTNTLVGLSKDKASEAKFIDDAVSFWNETFSPGMQEILEKVRNTWVKDAVKTWKDTDETE